jgi:hypothetical protein
MGKNFVWKLTNGAIVHPECREAYQNALPKGSGYVAIASAIHSDQQTGELPPSSMLPSGRFCICGHCQKPIVEFLAR